MAAFVTKAGNEIIKKYGRELSTLFSSCEML